MYENIRTVLNIGTGEYEEKRSRFLAWVFPVSSEEEVFSHLEFLRKNIMMQGITAMLI